VLSERLHERKHMQKILTRIVGALTTLYKEYPSRANALIVSAIVAIAGLAGIVVSPQSIETVIAVVLPILITGELTHHKVTPVKAARRR
jgi:hypothetical protein